MQIAALIAIFLTGMRHPVWIPWLAWAVFFGFVLFASIGNLKSNEKLTTWVTRVLIIHGAAAFVIGLTTAGMAQNAVSQGLKLCAIAVVVAGLAIALAYQFRGNGQEIQQ